MIYDKIEKWSNYFKEPIFKKIFKDLEDFNIKSPNGVYVKEGYTFKVMSYETKLEPVIIESHRREVDIQILFSGNEKIKIYDSNSVEVIKRYDVSTDCEFYKAVNNPLLELSLKPNFMAVFFPQDIHYPQFIVDNKIEKLKKIVIKVDEKFFT
ncbi:YhcH/YjgK/YiaL family protein [Tenacibaculum insulae]|uniref:YhcH/YjgK/YiaL family protein n=1 Tax=Tenacibaculum insulae TaxID=2029677 RepID=UPI003AB3C6B4